MQINRYDAEGLRHEMEENGELVSFIFRDREVVAEESQAGRIRYIRTGELLASDAEYARTYYHYASDEMGSITHVVAGEWKETAATWQDNGSALTEEWKKSALAGQGNVSILAGQDNKTVESGEVPENSILNRYEYDAWGNLTICDETVSNRFRFNGQQYDPVSQQYYLRARYYNPVIGRFTQEDTYRGDGLNLYAYCRNNPVYYVDPSGHMTCEEAREHMRRAIAANQDIRGIDPSVASQLRKWYENKKSHGWLSDDEINLANQIGLVNVSGDLSAGKNFKDHYIRHKGLLEKLTGEKYPKYKDSNNGIKFLQDLQNLINDGTLEYQGLGTIKKGAEPMNIYRGNGLTLITKTNGEFVTLLESGMGMDLGIQFLN